MSGAEEPAFHRLGEAQDRREQAIARADTDAQTLAARDCGEAHFAVGQYQLAKALLREAESLIEGTGRHRELLPGLIGLAGRASQRQKLWEQALHDYRRAAAVAEQLALSAEHLRWAGKEATTVLDMGESERGLPLLEASVELGRGLPADDAVDGVLSDLLARLAREVAESDPERAEKLWEETFERLDRIERGRFHFFAAVNYGTFLLFQRDKTYLARTHFEEALEIGHELGLDGEHLRDVVLRLSATLREREPGRAGDLLLAELPTQTDPRARHELLTAAVAHYYAGNLWSEMKTACRALRELREQGGTTMGRYDVEMSLSIACRGLGETDEALAALGRAREHAEKLGDPGVLTAVRGQTAIMHVDRGEFAAALQLARELWEEGSRDRLTARTYVESLIALGDVDRARAIRDEFAAASGEKVDISWMSAKLADAGDGDPVAAWYAYGAAADRAPDVEAVALSRLHDLHPPGSDDRFEASKARLRLIERGRAQVTDVFSEESWLALTPLSRDFPTYLDEFVESACAVDRHAEAIYELERFRSQMLVDVIANRAAGWSIDPSDRLEVKAMMTNQFHRARYRLQGLDALGAGWQSRREAAAEVDRLEAIALSAGGLIHFAPGFTGLTFPRDLDEHLAGSALGEEERLVFLHAGGGRAHVWAMDGRGGIEHTVLPGLTANRLQGMHAGLWRTSARARAPFGSTRDLRPEAVAPELESTLADLDRLLTGPLVEWLAALGTQRAFLAAGTGVTSLPVDRGPAADAAGIEFSFLPSARLLGYARSPRVPSSYLFPAVDAASRAETGAELMRSVRGRVRVLVDPTCSLRFAPVEAAIVAASFPDGDVETLAPEAVTREAAELAARTTEIVHVIGHGTFADASPYRSGMYLGRGGAKDDVWTVADVLTGVDAPAGRLAVLSGCETGRVRPNIVSEEVSLPAAFLAAGYAAVVGSRWVVDDLSTSLFMGDLYVRWLAGAVSIARAAAESTDWLRRLDRDTAADLVASLPPPVGASAGGDGAGNGYVDAAAALRVGRPHPFEGPEHWAAFYVAGDGAITADGIDSRVP